MDEAVPVVPMQGKPNITPSIPVHGDFVVPLQCLDEMVSVFFSDIFDAEIVHTEGKANGSSVVRPETGVDFALVVPVSLEALFEELLCDYSGLR